jgi:hypothetical protein
MTIPTMLMQRAHDEAVGDHAPELADRPKRRTLTRRLHRPQGTPGINWDCLLPKQATFAP